MVPYIVREYGLLSRSAEVRLEQNPIDRQAIPASAWDWLLAECCGDGLHKQLVRPRKVGGSVYLQVLNYAGVITTPCGTQLEIVPKSFASNNWLALARGRKVLLKMLNRVYDLKVREFDLGNLELFDGPLHEILIGHFLNEVKALIRQGARSSYRDNMSELSFLRGRLRTSDQLRQPPSRQHKFQVEYEEFSRNRPENRLIRSSLAHALKWSKITANQRLARELIFAFDDIPTSKDTKADFRKWQSDRTMQHYKPLKYWCELILEERNPRMLAGKHFGQSFLFPMNELFERYVGSVLRSQLRPGFELKEQASSKYLIESYSGKPAYQLRPDILILNNKRFHSVLDCKWKILSQSSTSRFRSSVDDATASQGDLYQLFAYGHKYLNGEGATYLIYPHQPGLELVSEPMEYSDRLQAFMIPFDLETDRFCGLPPDFMTTPNIDLSVSN
ncbi:McrC family protein [Microbulbifer sediminum]|uniref:McrC family protein n=1 Tax=Microbulbifer sediminum TaxID=2904250 RepID=UPI001F248309|nr:McrC family protein [Microbulbifer sediminum]